jgi:putative two-component system response regulator
MRGVLSRKASKTGALLAAGVARGTIQAGMHDGRRAQLLVVDDDTATREVLRQMLETDSHDVATAASAAEARKAIQGQAFDVVLCDVQMPGESGLSLAAHLAAEYPGTATLMVTGVDNSAVAEATVAFGAFGYLLKPVRMTELLASVDSALRRLELQAAARRERDALEMELAQQTAELRDAVQRLELQADGQTGSDAETMRRLARAIEYRSRETGEHIDRVAQFCGLIGRRMGLSREVTHQIGTASVMHDVGKVAVADEVLLKPGPLNPDERQQMERHAEIGYEVLRASEGPLMQLAASIAWAHHERFDGNGYPRGLSRDEIPREARIVAVADVFDALTHDRVYRPALPLDEVLAIMGGGRGSHLDPDALDPLLESLDDALAIAGPAAVSVNGGGREAVL